MERRLWSAGAPVDVVPVADDREQEKHDRNQQQSGGFKRIDVVPGTATPGLLLGDSHENIVAPGEKSEANDKLRRFRQLRCFCMLNRLAMPRTILRLSRVNTCALYGR